MAVRRETYGLPDETLQLIAGSPELSIPMMQQGSAAQFATPDARRSDLISALRGIPGAANPGFTRYANAANGSALTPAARKQLNVISPARLTLAKYIAPEVTLPGGEIGTPYVKPDTPFVDDFVFRDVVVDDDVVDDDVVDDDVVDDDVVDDDIVDDDIVDDTDDTDDTVEDDFDLDLDTTLLEDVVVPDEKEKTGTVDIEVVDGLEAQDDGTTDGILDLINAGFDDGSEKTGTVDIEVVDNNDAQDDGTTGDILDLINSGLPGDQDDFIQDDGTTDGIQDIIDSMGDGSGGTGGEDDYLDSYDFGNDFGYDFGGGGGGGKYLDDISGGAMAFAKGGKVTPNRLAGPNPPGPDDGFATLKNGEFVLNKEAAEAIGYELLNRLNRSRR